MTIGTLSAKQKRAVSWWRDEPQYDAVICDGAVRSGKTVAMGLSFFLWAMSAFSGESFALCGKTVKALRRNVTAPMIPLLQGMGFRCAERLSSDTLTVEAGGRRNTFYLFGGKDEGSAALIQGSTFAGALFDEAALQPRSFVEQACARCSVEGSRFFFSCNPESPGHWFYREWICRAAEKNALYLHFTMEDNPSLSKSVRKRYERMYSGAFYRRFVLGEWITAEGLVYDFFSEDYVQTAPEEGFERWYISCDYGTANPASFGLWGLRGGVWYRVKEYYFDSREEGYQKTDEEYADELERLAGEREISGVVVDPSAASFMEALRRRGYAPIRAKNDVLSGIRVTADLLKSRRLVICGACTDAIREFSLYIWDDRAAGDAPKKENDHAMDDIRYFAATVAAEDAGGFAVTFAER